MLYGIFNKLYLHLPSNTWDHKYKYLHSMFGNLMILILCKWDNQRNFNHNMLNNYSDKARNLFPILFNSIVLSKDNSYLIIIWIRD